MNVIHRDKDKEDFLKYSVVLANIRIVLTQPKCSPSLKVMYRKPSGAFIRS